MHIKQTHNEISHMNNGFNQVLNTIQVPFSLPVQLLAHSYSTNKLLGTSQMHNGMWSKVRFPSKVSTLNE